MFRVKQGHGGYGIWRDPHARGWSSDNDELRGNTTVGQLVVSLGVSVVDDCNEASDMYTMVLYLFDDRVVFGWVAKRALEEVT